VNFWYLSVKKWYISVNFNMDYLQSVETGTGAGVGPLGRPGPGKGGMTDVLGGPVGWGAAAGEGCDVAR
jgi:hypothetical protein